MPSIRAASATPCAWLPALAATTPRACSSAREPRHAHVRAAQLERAGALQVLALEPAPRPRTPATARGSSCTGRAVRDPLEQRRRRPDVGEAGHRGSVGRRPVRRARRRPPPRCPTTARRLVRVGALRGLRLRRDPFRRRLGHLRDGPVEHGVPAPAHGHVVVGAELRELVVPVQVEQDGVEGRGDRHREQRADDARDERARRHRQQHRDRVQRHRVAHEERLEHVPLDLLHERARRRASSRAVAGPVGHERDEDRDRPGDDRADDRDERAEEHEHGQRQRERHLRGSPRRGRCRRRRRAATRICVRVYAPSVTTPAPAGLVHVLAGAARQQPDDPRPDGAAVEQEEERAEQRDERRPRRRARRSSWRAAPR